jgi:hypothetical protein
MDRCEYLDYKTHVTVSGLKNHCWKEKDFWQNIFFHKEPLVIFILSSSDFLRKKPRIILTTKTKKKGLLAKSNL